MEKGLQIANDHNLYPLELKLDSTDVINIIFNGHELQMVDNPGEANVSEKLSMRHNFRKENQIAHMMAKETSNKDPVRTPKSDNLDMARAKSVLNIDPSSEA
ncbi:hypothetical protein RND71_007632 [Anisodus tanguticus]|uniref:Uncharacterized protein n=1 Tax=Anisodus tanguticus TaxID=243964 RepID=A0AAE1VJA4_9SOLA|nr:hypothetical protein RND71_007632 [Anisodus tanguticus]